MLNYSERKQLKDEKFAKTNSIWCENRFNSIKKIGSMNAYFKQYYKDFYGTDLFNINDFINYYYLNVHTREEITEIAIEFYKKCKGIINISIYDAYYYTIIRIFDETWDGFNREIRIINYLSKKYKNCDVKFSQQEDTQFCIDLIVSCDNKQIAFYQVKPISFLNGLNKEYCKKAYLYNTEKHNEFYKKTGKKVLYIFDDNDNFIIKPYDKIFS